MFNLFKKTENQKINELSYDVSRLKIELKDIRDAIEKLEIKALEVKKLYHKKLNDLYGQEDKKGKDIYNGVLLSDNGNT